MRDLVLRRILAPVDLSDSSVPALRYARLFAERWKAAVTIFHSDPVVYPLGIIGDTPRPAESRPERLARLRRDVDSFVAPVLEGVAFDIDVATGQPAAAIVAAAKRSQADLIVMGTHARHGWRRALVGSVAEQVLPEATVPVLVVNKDEKRRAELARIICPVNYSPVAGEALRYAGMLAATLASELIVVHVDEHPGADWPQARSWIQRQIPEVWTYRNLVVRGGAAERVLDCVEDLDADLLVIGSQPRRLQDVTVIGTTSERLVRLATCPVLVVPAARIEEHAPAVEEEVGATPQA